MPEYQFYFKGEQGTVLGPLTRAAIEERARLGEIVASTQVRVNDNDWVFAGDLVFLREAIGVVTPRKPKPPRGQEPAPESDQQPSSRRGLIIAACVLVGFLFAGGICVGVFISRASKTSEPAQRRDQAELDAAAHLPALIQYAEQLDEAQREAQRRKEEADYEILARAYRANFANDHRLALSLLNQLDSKAMERQEVLSAMAQAFSGLGETNKAIQMYELAVKARSIDAATHHMVHHNLGCEYRRAKRFDEAIAMLAIAVRLGTALDREVGGTNFGQSSKGQLDLAVAEKLRSR